MVEAAPKRAPRRAVHRRCALDFADRATMHGFTANLSATGVAVEVSAEALLEAPRAEGDELSVSLVLPNDTVTRAMRAQIVWCAAPASVGTMARLGLRFIEPDASAVAAIAHFVATFRTRCSSASTTPWPAKPSRACSRLRTAY